MITQELLPDLKRMGRLGAFRPPMLMLGAQESRVPAYPTARSWFTHWVGEEYDDLDLEDGSLKLDLNADLRRLELGYASVFNLGTIEHVWDAHRAWANALRAVQVGGAFATHSPVGGWVDTGGCLDHGVHMTERGSIEKFLTRNGFEVVDSWVTSFRQRGRLLWLVAEKRRHIGELASFRPVYQVRGLASTYRSEL